MADQKEKGQFQRDVFLAADSRLSPRINVTPFHAKLFSVCPRIYTLKLHLLYVMLEETLRLCVCFSCTSLQVRHCSPDTSDRRVNLLRPRNI